MPDIVPITRDEHGLLPGVEYILNGQGGVDWRKMVKPEFLVPNLQYEPKIEELYGKPVAELSVSDIDDKYLLILLGGIKELARLRGFSSVKYNLHPINEIFVAASCEITWIPNFETEQREITFSDGADATNDNTNGFGKSYLTPIAINRAFVRAVKNFLGINILGKDEIAPHSAKESPLEQEQPVSSSPHVILQKTMETAGLTFEKLKKTCINKNIEGADGWLCIYDIPLSTAFDLIGKINQKINKK